MNTKSSIVTLVVVAVAITAVSYFLKPTINVGVSPTPVTVNVPEQKTPVVNVNVPKGTAPIVNVPAQTGPTLGSVPGPDLYTDYFNQNGVVTFSATRNGLNQASTTLCSFQSPKTGTSTLSFGSIEIASSTTLAYKITFAQSTNMTGSTSPFGLDISYGAGVQSTSIATSTYSGVVPPALIFAPGSYFNVTLAAADSGLFNPRGTCKAQFKVTSR